ncbi:MAG: WhiB family transcriptional regulator [Streptosporangiaceae bacterium]
MSDNTTLSDAVRLLSPQLLQDARSDIARGWAAWALCVGFDPEAFFPSGDDAAAEARAICAACPVRGQCLAYAITADERFGIWGGLDPRQRHTVRRRLERRYGSSSLSGNGTAA